jgi:hypothetical protein
MLLYKGNILMKHKNILVVPVETFLKNPEDFLTSN